jgi:hypothetical protein
MSRSIAAPAKVPRHAVPDRLGLSPKARESIERRKVTDESESQPLNSWAMNRQSPELVS